MKSRMRGLAACALTIAFVGCGSSEPTDEGVVVVPDAGKVPTAGGTGASASNGSETAATDSGDSAAPAAATNAEGWGTLKGRVIFDGDPPTPEILVAQGSDVKDAAICAATPIPSEKLVVDPETKGVRWALVYIPRPSAVNPDAEAAALAAEIDFDQLNCVFEPHVLAAMKGATVNIKSDDKAGHNVHSQLRGTQFNQGIQPGSAVPVVIKSPDNRPGSVVCDIHQWMKAWWLTLSNPYFAVTNAKGEFLIENVPAGSQKVVVWSEATHPGFVTSSASGDPVTIAADTITTQDYTIKSSQVK